MNSEIAKITGSPVNASQGKLARQPSLSGPGDLGMGGWNPRKGANPRGKYIVDGTSAYGSGGSGKVSRSQLRSAGESR